MISFQKQFIFVHVPKTAGNSIQNVLMKYSEDEIVCSGKTQDGIERFKVVNPKYNTVKHSPLSQYKKVLPDQAFKNMIKFATVRNPWDMLISLYFSPVLQFSTWDPDIFKDIVDKTPPVRSFLVAENDAKKPLDNDLDYIMRFENLNEDFREICDKMNIPHEKIPHRNKSNRKHYSYYYNSELIDLIATKYAEEIDFFGYDFIAL